MRFKETLNKWLYQMFPSDGGCLMSLPGSVRSLISGIVQSPLI